MDQGKTPSEIVARWNITELFHFTAGPNCRSIREHGGLFSLAELSKRNIHCQLFLSSVLSRELDREFGLDRYVRLSLVKDCAMLRDALDRAGDQRVLRLIISPAVLSTPGARFTREIAMQAQGHTYPIEEMDDRLDLNVVYGVDKPTRKPDVNWTAGKARRAEILIPNHIPISMVLDYEWVK